MQHYTLQETGHAPLTVEAELVAENEQHLSDKPRRRGVHTRLFRVGGTGALMYLLELTFTSDWARERPCTQICEAGSLVALAGFAQRLATRILPPGAGYPALPAFAARQEQLQGLLQSLALDSISTVLAAAHSSTHAARAA